MAQQDQSLPDQRAHNGSPDDRKPSPKVSITMGAMLALATGFADWVFLQCYTGGQWHYVPPSQTLIEMAGPIILAPLLFYVVQVFSLIGDIIINRLEKAEGETK